MTAADRSRIAGAGAEHRWSGWPGAFCLRCGAEDKVEICVGEHPEAFSGEETLDNPMGFAQHCVNGPCPASVGAGRATPAGEE